MATIRGWLEKAGFDWEKAYIVYQPYEGYCPGWESPIGAEEVDPKEEGSVLDDEFPSGHGAPRCPRFVATDGDFIYFPIQYDGVTWVGKVAVDLTRYLDWKLYPTPYPGG